MVFSGYVICVWPIMSDVLKICSSFACTIAINLVVTRLSWHGDSQVTWWLMLRPRSTRPCPVCHCRSGYSRGPLMWGGDIDMVPRYTLTYLGYPEPCVGRGSVTYWYDKYTRSAPHYAQTLLQEWVLLHWNASTLNSARIFIFWREPKPTNTQSL